MSKARMTALKRVMLFLVQKAIGIACVVIPFAMHFTGLSADDQNEGMFFIIAIPIGLWLLFSDELLIAG